MPQCDTSTSTSSGPSSGTGRSSTVMVLSPTYTAAGMSVSTTKRERTANGTLLAQADRGPRSSARRRDAREFAQRVDPLVEQELLRQTAIRTPRRAAQHARRELDPQRRG